MGVTLAPCLKQCNHRNNSNQTIINNVTFSNHSIWNSSEYPERRRAKEA
jgi:hypothetical protein